jgi:hypothetical protein
MFEKSWQCPPFYLHFRIQHIVLAKGAAQHSSANVVATTKKAGQNIRREVQFLGPVLIGQFIEFRL